MIILSENLALADSSPSIIDQNDIQGNAMPQAQNAKIEVLSFGGKPYLVKNLNETAAWATQEALEETLPEAFTICSATARHTGSNCQVFFTILGENDNHYLSALAISDHISTMFYYMVEEEMYVAGENISFLYPSEWIHSCMAITKLSSHLQIQWIIDGITVENTTIETEGSGSRSISGKIVLGAVYDYWDNDQSFPWSSERFYLTNLNVYSSHLPLEKMQRLTREGNRTCQDLGDILGWGELPWQTYGAVAVKSAYINNFCAVRESMILFREHFKTLDQCMQHCDQKVGGRVKSVVTRSELDEAYGFLFDTINGANEYVWMSVTDPEQKGEWQDVYTGERIEYMNASDPGQKDYANFAVQDDQYFYDLEGYIWDKKTNYTFYCLCSLGPVNLRGICLDSSYYSTTPTSPIETQYMPQRISDSAQVFTYVSDFESVIHYDISKTNESNNEPIPNYWVISKSSKILLKSEDPLGKTVFGKRNWTVQSKSPLCNKGQNETIELKFTG